MIESGIGVTKYTESQVLSIFLPKEHVMDSPEVASL